MRWARKCNVRWDVAGSRESLGTHYAAHLGSNDEMSSCHGDQALQHPRNSKDVKMSFFLGCQSGTAKINVNTNYNTSTCLNCYTTIFMSTMCVRWKAFWLRNQGAYHFYLIYYKRCHMNIKPIKIHTTWIIILIQHTTESRAASSWFIGLNSKSRL